MDILLLTRRPGLTKLFNSVLKTVAVLTFPYCSELLATLVDQSQRSKPALVAIDLGTRMNLPNFVSFLRLSPATSHVPLMGVGSLADYEALDDDALADFNHHLLFPVDTDTISAVVNHYDNQVPALNPGFLPGSSARLRLMFSKSQLCSQIRIFRRKGLSLADHAFALNAAPGEKDYAALEKLWLRVKSPLPSTHLIRTTR
jgi:hypothetical protein